VSNTWRSHNGFPGTPSGGGRFPQLMSKDSRKRATGGTDTPTTTMQHPTLHCKAPQLWVKQLSGVGVPWVVCLLALLLTWQQGLQWPKATQAGDVARAVSERQRAHAQMEQC
jgi:hypothetical protein